MPTASDQDDQLSSQLEATAERLVRLEAFARVAATAAHDFGNALMAISLFQGFIAEGLGPGHELAADVAAIGEAVARGRAIQTQLVAVRQASPGEAQERLDALAVLDGLYGTLKAIASPATLRLEAEGEGEGAGEDHVVPGVEMAQRALEDAVLNLVINASDAMASRAGVITVTVGTELLTAASALGLPGGTYVTVTVADDGPGMTREVLDRVGETFFTTKDHGTGLGLPSVLRTARRAGGEVRIESEPGLGTTVTLLLPEAGGS